MLMLARAHARTAHDEGQDVWRGVHCLFGSMKASFGNTQCLVTVVGSGRCSVAHARSRFHHWNRVGGNARAV
jgi:hypothetical protein